MYEPYNGKSCLNSPEPKANRLAYSICRLSTFINDISGAIMPVLSTLHK